MTEITTSNSEFTVKDVQEFEDQRQIFYDQLGHWWDRYNELIKLESQFRDRFRKKFGMSYADGSTEYVISEWKRRNNIPLTPSQQRAWDRRNKTATAVRKRLPDEELKDVLSAIQ